MIDYNKTILNNIRDRINKMRFLGKQSPEDLKVILSLIIVSDLQEWSVYRKDSEAIYNALQKIKDDILFCHKEINLAYCDEMMGHYMNVNTPQNIDTWTRMWDRNDVIIIDDHFNPVTESSATSFIPDDSCEVQVVYYGTGEKYASDNEGKPSINIDNLTTCEKMNIYINRQTGKMYYLNPDNCQWTPVNTNTTNVNWKDITNKPTIYSGIHHELVNSENMLNVKLTEATVSEEGEWDFGNQSSDVPTTNSTDLEDVL